MTMSLDVKIVNIDVNTNKTTNNPNWDLLHKWEALKARYLKKPASSRKIDKNVIEKNKAKILSGLIEESLVNDDQTLSIGERENAIIKMAITKATIQ